MQTEIKQKCHISDYRIERIISQSHKCNIYQCILDKNQDNLNDKQNIQEISQLTQINNVNEPKYAMKVFFTQEKTKYINNEINCLKKINCLNVVKIKENFLYQGHPCIVMEWCNQMTLHQFQKFQPFKRFSEDIAKNIFRSILYGVCAIHQQGIVHRNLTCDNIIFDDEIPKICGFGLSRLLLEDQLAFSLRGSLAYLAPEIVNGYPYNNKVDVWSLGVILFVMLYHKFPFGIHKHQKSQQKELMQYCFPFFKLSKVTEKYFNQPKISDHMSDLFRSIFTLNSNQRISLYEIWSHPAIAIEYRVIDMPDIHTKEFQKLELLESQQKQQQPEKQNNLKNTELFSSFQDKLNQTTKSTFQDWNQQSFIGQEKTISKKNNEDCDQIGYYTDSFEEQQRIIASNLLVSDIGSLPNLSDKFFLHYKVYIFQKERIRFLIENCEFFKENKKFFLIVGQLDIILLRYFLVKIISFFCKWFLIILKTHSNQFNLPNFEEFCSTEYYTNLHQQAEKDDIKFDSDLEDAYEEVTEIKELLNQEIYQCLEPQIIISYKETYIQMPKEFKLPYRAILLSIYQKLREDAAKFARKETKIKLDFLSYKEQINYFQKEANQRQRQAYRILLLSCVNYVFQADTYEICVNDCQIKLEELFNQINTIKYQDASQLMDQLYNKYYKKLKNQRIKNISNLIYA